MTELDPGITGGELPVHWSAFGIDGLLPMTKLAVERIDVGDPPGKALARERGKLDLGDVEP